MKCMFLWLFLLVFGVSSMSTAQQSADEVADWREDLAFLREQMEAIHPNLFWRFPRETFDAAFAALDADLPTLTREQTLVRLMQIVALIDAHTQMFPLQEALGFHEYPIRLYNFSDGLFVIDALPPYEDLIGAQVVGVGGTGTQMVMDRVETLSPYDNAMTRLVAGPQFFTIPEVLHAFGFIEDMNAPGFMLTMPDGSERVVDLTPVSADEYFSWVLPEVVGLPRRDNALHLSRRDEAFWADYLTNEDTLYVQYNLVQGESGAMTLFEFTTALGDWIETETPARVVLDMRHNSGGNNRTYAPLMTLLTQNELLTQPNRLFVIIGRQTFSAAVNFVAELAIKNPNVIFVGEPTGARPNLYGDTRPVILPNSQINIQVSSLYWVKSTPDDERDALPPDIPAELSSSDFFNGRDPVLDAVFTYQS